ncbi:MAG: RnfABCDGE type electron transport complex subunit D [Candidatus Latescibacteria bacterium]|nr:RnfABCDGE type electron transport complex subunit D [Candidatus Latescibacterota bacterium]
MSQTENAPVIRVAPAPHLIAGGMSARRMMVDVLVALSPLVGMALYVFGWYALWMLALCAVSCLAAEAAFVAWRGKKAQLGDFSALVTGLILGLSLPWSTPWYAAVVASVVAIGLGKIAFGGLGQNLFNPAMVGRAFVMVCFPAALGAAAYRAENAALDAVVRATPLTAAKQLGQSTELIPLLVGTVNGSLGETSALACLLGGGYLCFRRAASWQIPVAVMLSAAVLGGLGDLLGAQSDWTMLHHLAGGALLFGAFFIATDPVSSPLTKKGKWIYGAGIGALVMLLRLFSGYPEGVMFAVLLMNATVPLINRWTIPRPVGGPVPA